MRIHMISGRVIGIDFKLHGRNYSCISTYLPHCGYSQEEIDETYNQLRCLVSKAYRSNKRVIICGDFNTQSNVGNRGIALDQFVLEFRLCATNASDADANVNWTFESSMGVRRRLNFALASKLLLLVCRAQSII